ncbi:family 10 glycosylhydrolase [Chryseobacterium sp.]|nr:family 10 glycosylhydrolase [Chryseobacterium sp.]
MMIRHLKFFSFIIAVLFMNSCAGQPKVKSQKPAAKSQIKPPSSQQSVSAPVSASGSEMLKLDLPEIKREFRGAWIATVANINWPSRNNLTTDQQKAEAIKMLDLLKDNNFNAVIFQARPSADALYNSPYEPWSYFLTGDTGKAPSPYYDPLEFWITEAHKRGMELHVWLNPYRAYHTTGGTINSQSMVKKMPDEIVKLRNGTYWFDPANQKTQDHVSEVVKDLVKRYDIDGVHFDDYFYPYKEYNGGRDFPDDKSWNAFLTAGGTLSRPDWRRANVNKFIKRIYEEIKAEKKGVKFGISPFGIWKPGFPADVKGSSQYDELFADAKLWLNEGWVDYFSPQLYWKEEGQQRFSSLLKWWNSENKQKRHLWPGLNTVGVKDVPDRPSEILKQINISREILNGSDGEIHYSIAGLTQDTQMATALRNGPYREKALIPKSSWLTAELPAKPLLTVNESGGTAFANWSAKKPGQVFLWVLFTKYGDSWQTEILNADIISKNILMSKSGEKLTAVALKAIDRLGNESAGEAMMVIADKNSGKASFVGWASE